MSWKQKTTGLTVLFPVSLSAGLTGGRVEMLSRPCWQTHPWNWNLSACDNLCDSKFRAASHSRSCWRLVFKLSRRKQGFLRWAWKSLNNLCRMDFAASLHLSQSQRLFWRSSSRWGSVVINNSSSWFQTSPWHIFCSPTQNCRSSAGVDGFGWPQAVLLGAAPLMDMLLDPDPMADSFLHIPNLSCSDGLHCI